MKLPSPKFRPLNIRFETDDEYRAYQAINSSWMGDFRRSPRHYQANWEVPSESTKDQQFGSAYHVFLLENDQLEKRYVTVDPEKRPEQTKGMTSKINNEWLQEITEGKQVLTIEQIEIMEAMRDAIMQHPMAKSLIEMDGYVEVADVFEIEIEDYNEKTHKFLGKRKIDKKIPELEAIVDLKTAADGKPTDKGYFRKAWDFGYFRQGAYYTDADPICQNFYQIVQEKKYPYAVTVLKMDDGGFEKGRHHMTEGYVPILREYARCRAMHGPEWGGKKWPAYEFWTKHPLGIFQLKPPSWT